MPKRKLSIASDHAGLNLKKFFIQEIQDVEWVDFGPQTGESVDYPDFAEKACKAIISGQCESGVLICGSGIGMSIAANKISGIRAAHSESTITAELAKLHNNANVLCIGERITGTAHALAMVKAWLHAEFESRHQKRIDKIHSLEK